MPIRRHSNDHQGPTSQRLLQSSSHSSWSSSLPGSRSLSSLAMAVAVTMLAGCSSMFYSEQSSNEQDWQQALNDERDDVRQWQLETGSADEQQNASPESSLLALMPSAEMKRLVNASLEANPGLQQSWFTLRRLQAEKLGTRADQLPSASLSFSGQRQQDSGNSFSTGLSISWELDLWAKLAASTTAAELDVAEQLGSWQQTRDTLVAEVMQGWLNLVQLNNSIRLQELRLQALRKNEQAIVNRYKAGIGSLDDLDSARTSLSSGEATLANNRYQLAEARRALRTLLGTTDDAKLAELGLTTPQEYPAVLLPLADLPEQTLARRPDLQSAWNGFQAASTRVDIAHKDMLPSINLSPSLTGSGSSPSLFSDPVWALVGSLTQPLFEGGKLKAAATAAEFSAAAAAQSYRDVLLTAVSEVENAIDNERTLAIREEAIRKALGTARSNEQRYLSRYRSGLATLLELISVQQSRYDLEDDLNTLIYERLSNRISLGLALGLPGLSSIEMTPLHESVKTSASVSSIDTNVFNQSASAEATSDLPETR